MDRTNDPTRCKSIHADNFYQCDSYVGHPGDHQSLTYALTMKCWTNEEALVPA